MFFFRSRNMEGQIVVTTAGNGDKIAYRGGTAVLIFTTRMNHRGELVRRAVRLPDGHVVREKILKGVPTPATARSS